MENALPSDFKEFLRLLNLHQVRYLLIGGYAINIYGYSRNTEDLDLWVEVSPDNAGHIVSAVREFGFAAASEQLFLARNQVIRMGVPPMRLEILTGISGVEFAACYARRRTENLAGLEIPIISPEDLIANKRAAGRLKDLADVERIHKMTKNS